MKFLIIGLGSMGKRRIRNLQYLGHKEIIGFEINEDRQKEAFEKYGVKSYSQISKSLEEKPDAIIISTPPDLHMKYAKIAIENNIPFFTEASVNIEEVEEVIQKLKDSNVIGLPSCTYRYHPIISKVKQILDEKKIGKCLSVIHHSGQYLPDWHPWEDYTQYYVSKKDTGACREIVPFELVWLTWIFGEIKSVIGSKRKITGLKTDIDDIYSVLLEFKNGIEGNLTVDVISRFPYRQLKILGSDGVITADWTERKVGVFTKDEGWNYENIEDGKIEQNYIHGEEPYITEMTNFIKIIKNEIVQPYTFEEDLKILKILNLIENSSDNGQKQMVNF
jgi:predicted dehydrogenase